MIATYGPSHIHLMARLGHASPRGATTYDAMAEEAGLRSPEWGADRAQPAPPRRRS